MTKKHWILITTLLLVGFVLLVGGLIIELTTEYPTMLIGLFILLAGSITFFCGLTIYIKRILANLHEIKTGNNTEEKNDNTKENEKSQSAKKILEKYRSITTTALDATEIDKDKLLIVAKSFGVKTMEEALKLYEMALEIEKQSELDKIKKQQEAEQEKIEKQFSNKRKQEEATYKEQKESASFVGKDKYSHVLAKKIKDYNENAASRSFVLNYANEMARTYVNTDNAISGVIYNGVVVDANEIKRNAEARAARTRKQGQELKAELEKKYREAAPKKAEIAFCEHVNTRLIDDENAEEKFKELKISNVHCSMTAGNNFKVYGNISCNNKYSIAEQPAILDGILLIEIKDENNKTIADGFISTPWNNGTDLSLAGFQGEMKFNSICLVPDKLCRNIDTNKKYSYNIKPLNMWLIEI